MRYIYQHTVPGEVLAADINFEGHSRSTELTHCNRSHPTCY